MAVNYEKYLQLLAHSFKKVYAETAKKHGKSNVVKAGKPSRVGDYGAGIAVLYEDRQEKLAGQFFLGFTDTKKATRLAAAIEGRTHLSAAAGLDDISSKILNKFLCTVVDQTVTEWDALGLSTEFGPPLTLKAKKIKKTPPTQSETYIVTLSISGESVAMHVIYEEFVESRLKGKKILVVDDSRVVRMVLAKALKGAGCEVVEAVDGRDAVEKFRAEQPELTITDMVMPNMDGLEAIDRIRKMSPQAKVLVLTSAVAKKEVMAAAQLGIRGYVKKPVKPERLIDAAVGCFS